MTLPTIRYGEASLADLMPSVLASLGVAGERNALQLPESTRTVVLLVDGMGWELLRRHPDVAPFLTSLAGRPLTAGFPATTATSLSSLGTGLPPGGHGLTGYSSYVEELDETVGWLGWAPSAGGPDLRERLVPEQVQPARTVFERATEAGVAVTLAAPMQFVGSGLTRAVLRGGSHPGTVAAGDVLAQAVAGARAGERALVYCYLAELDLVGHVRGSESDAWRDQLRLVDDVARGLADRLPAGTTLLVTADHGMVDVAQDEQVDYDSCAALSDGVHALAGEPRMRHVHVVPGALDAVLAAWRAEVGDRMWVGRREEAIAAGLFGPVVTDAARGRIGDVLAVAHGSVGVVRRTVEPMLSSLTGQHGAATPEELLVPLLHGES
jgi:hypothetical protein